jgi:hypothetical protein
MGKENAFQILMIAKPEKPLSRKDKRKSKKAAKHEVLVQAAARDLQLTKSPNIYKVKEMGITKSSPKRARGGTIKNQDSGTVVAI